MICPECNTQLAISNTHGIEIDYCPNCRGIWLNKGELEKIIERSSTYGQPDIDQDEHYRNHEHHNDKHHDKQYGYNKHSTNRKGFFSELFDF
jgi:uncharacterized protein